MHSCNVHVCTFNGVVGALFLQLPTRYRVQQVRCHFRSPPPPSCSRNICNLAHSRGRVAIACARFLYLVHAPRLTFSAVQYTPTHTHVFVTSFIKNVRIVNCLAHVLVT